VSNVLITGRTKVMKDPTLPSVQDILLLTEVSISGVVEIFSHVTAEFVNWLFNK